MKTFIAALSLLALAAIACSFVSLPEHRHAGRAGPSGWWNQSARQDRSGPVAGRNVDRLDKVGDEQYRQ